MRNILTLSAVMAFLLFAFSSCYKTHDCVCNIKTVTLDTWDTVKSTMTHYTIRGTKDDANAACKYYETDNEYLNRPAYEYHFCEIVDDYNKKYNK